MTLGYDIDCLELTAENDNINIDAEMQRFLDTINQYRKEMQEGGYYD